MSFTRRSFLKASMTTAGTLMVYAKTGPLAFASAEPANPMPFIELDQKGNMTFISPRTDMGQGSPTALAQIVLDEMDADWDKLVSVRETDATTVGEYGDDDLTTAGALSMLFGWYYYRQAGASLREGFKLAASGLWQTDSSRLITQNSQVIDPVTGRRFNYHELFDSLSTLYLPKVPDFKTREQSNLVGRPLPQLRSRERVTGEAEFGMDINFPGLKIAMIERCPTIGGQLKSFDCSSAMKIKGVLSVVQVDHGVAVVAEGFWAAQKGRKALSIEWDAGQFKKLSSQDISNQLKEKLAKPDAIETEAGDIEIAFSNSDFKSLSGNFSFPFVAHATMEPMNATAWVTDDKCEIWAPTQSKIIAHEEAAKYLGRKKEDITFHRTLCGGGFGRRAQEDFVLEAVDVSRKSGYPVKLIWSREDDIRHDYFRTISELKIKASLDSMGKLIAWDSRLAFINTTPYHFVPKVRNTKYGAGIGKSGIVPAYDIPNKKISTSMLDIPITVGILRGISHGYTNFAIEVMIDRMAKLGNKNPLEFRAELLKKNKRAHHVIKSLEVIASENPVPNNMARGFAFAYEGEPGDIYQYYSAHIADVRHLKDGSIKVHKIWVVADHGRVINPSGFKRQIHSSIYFALSMMRSGKITLKDGAIEQRNFDDYPVSLIGEGAENIEIKLVDNDEHPMGCGEKMQAGIQPAIANAIENLTGKNVNSIPIKRLA